MYGKIKTMNPHTPKPTTTLPLNVNKSPVVISHTCDATTRALTANGKVENGL